MRLHYISPSVLPSRSANSVHVVWQCDGLCRAGAEVTLYAKRSVRKADELPLRIRESYGVEHPSLEYGTFYNSVSLGSNLQIATFSRRQVSREATGAIVSRNLYAAYMLAVAQKLPLVFETHQLEYGFRKYLQRSILDCPWVQTISISNHLDTLLREHHGLDRLSTLVLHDAAPEGCAVVPANERRPRLKALEESAGGPWKLVCGYFGHLYKGRGIDVVQAMAAASPENLFLVFGGTPSDVTQNRNKNKLRNLIFKGHVPHPLARQLMSLMDVLLMPYQSKVSVGVSRHDTGRWMSPMKMFEYLGAGVPIISSDLPVLREVLSNEHNCLLVPPSDPTAWTNALSRIGSEPALAERIGTNAHKDYAQKHTWTRRAEAIMSVAKQL